MVCDRDHNIIYDNRLWPSTSSIIYTGLVFRQNTKEIVTVYYINNWPYTDHIYDHLKIKAINR
jgi:hypothetical protein